MTGFLYLLSIDYDGSRRKAVMKLYDTESERIVEIPDWSGHKPYFLTDLSPEEVIRIREVVGHKGFDHLEVVEKFDPISHKRVLMTKIVARDPLSVGGSRGAMREYLKGRSWEAAIKYHSCYIYDMGLIPGMPYIVENGRLKPVPVGVPHDIKSKLAEIYNYEQEILKEVIEWAKILQAPIPSIKRLALDIEVYTRAEHVPSPQDPRGEVIAVSLAGSDGLRKVLILRRSDIGGEEAEEVYGNVEVEYFNSEVELLKRTFEYMRSYPLILTFNGDRFDLPYLRARALKLGMKEDEIPITIRRREKSAMVIGAIHVDLYRFFNNRSMQTYAFGNKYREAKTLNEIAIALLEEGKVALEKPISELSYKELAEYCFKDAELTLRLTQFSGDLVMKLIILLMRISKMGIEDLTRHNISAWIKNMMYFEHRRLGYLIPNPQDIIRAKGKTATKAIIKGKKYLGAIVIDPLPGVFFNVSVVDFASLYPSVIKRWNLSYETVLCPHKECRHFKVPGTPHWVCRKIRGLSSKLIGFLRDLRVYIYKPLARRSEDPLIRSQYKVIEQALKVFINASYGVFGADTFPLYCPPMAECTTALGRYSIVRTLMIAREIGIPVLYGDTDSLFLWNPPREAIKELIDRVMRELHIDLDIDKEYIWVAFSGLKKNYLGVTTKGEVDVKGLLGKKRNTPEFIKELFSKTTSQLAKARNVAELELVVDDIRSEVIKSYQRLKKHGYSLDELAIRVTLSKPLDEYKKTTPQHVKAARQLARYGKVVEVGDIVSFVKIRGKEGVKPVQLARVDEIDSEKYVEHLRSTLEQILEALGISFEEIVGVKSLEAFMLS